MPRQIKGRKRHILVDTLGLLLNVVVHSATFRTAMAPSTCCAGRRDYSRSSNAFLLTADTRDARLAMMVWAHWCLELADRQAIGRCSI
ncbi:MAG: hypothetical protein ACXWC3_26775 [Burkholderiales bacterium]